MKPNFFLSFFFPTDTTHYILGYSPGLENIVVWLRNFQRDSEGKLPEVGFPTHTHYLEMAVHSHSTDDVT